MKIALFDAHLYDRTVFLSANQNFHHEIVFFEPRLTSTTALMAKGFPAVCSFVHDHLDQETLSILSQNGIKLIALRSAGFNHVDLVAAKKLSLTVVRVPAYSPHSVAEHTIALVLSLNRKIHRAHARVREGNFSLEGLIGFDLYQKTIGIIGLGKIGMEVAKIFRGFGCNILGFDSNPNKILSDSLDLTYVTLEELYERSDILSLHLPLTSSTLHIINEESISKMKPGVMLINTGRGGLIETSALIKGLKSGQIGFAGLDVYEEEEALFSQDLSEKILQDDLLARLLTFPNVLITAHQGYFTQEALQEIAKTTLENISAFEQGKTVLNEVTVP